jgi:hypothetical protein
LVSTPTKPWRSLKPNQKRELLYGKHGRYIGIFPFLKGLEQKRYKQYIRVFLRQYQLAHTCPVCHGSRLNEQALSVEIDGAVISSVSAKPVDELATWLEALSLSDFEREIAHLILDQLQRRIGYLRDVGLGYLTLDRLTRTLSGGEAQRIALANALGSNLVDALYVLDEPSIGLHPRDIDRLLGLLQRLRDAWQHRHRGGARSGGDCPGRFHARAGARRRREWWKAGICRTAGRRHRISHRAVFVRPKADRDSQRATSLRLLASRPRRHPSQPEGYRCGYSDWNSHRGDRSLRLRQEYLGT